ncbi:MAG: transglutaminase-like protein, partial [Planctomycetaceae bacterium]|nr:transglutaminase-like protein [Planctomycetaceae bacterium]
HGDSSTVSDPAISRTATRTANSTKTTNDVATAKKPADEIAAAMRIGNGQPKEAKATSPQAQVRKFTFQYRFRVKDLKLAEGPGKNDLVRVWIPCPSSSDDQEITRLDATTPAKLVEHKESRFGNRILFFETQIPASGEFTVDVPYQVVRHEVLQSKLNAEQKPAKKLDQAQLDRSLKADKMVPTTGKPLKMLEKIELSKDQLGLARQLYDIVDDHVVYKKEGTGWGRGDTNWVCDSGYGNCTDFHSLFISLARSQGLPARFEIGFSIPTDKPQGPVTGYHCWAWFYVNERGWVPVDISEADKAPKMKDYYFGNLTADRVMFSLGRDLELLPQAHNQPLNFFIFPYIEVGGETLPTKNVEMQCAFKNQQ